MSAILSESALPLPPTIAVSGDPENELTQRVYPEPPHPYRSPLARDAARILHARAFRRLAGKTQVFTRLPGELTTDHFRSRLTHTLEVAQISRTLARALGLNAELAEALALAHDIGHPPFGHAGEKALDRALRVHGLSFDHNLHALRIVTWFEERYPAFRGLNLTLAVREGIVKHSRDYSAATHPELAEYFLDQFPPLEAQLIDLTDEIAYLSADLDDGLDSGILMLDEVREAVPLFRAFHDAARKNYPDAAPRLAAYDALRRLLDAFVTDLLHEVRSAGDGAGRHHAGRDSPGARPHCRAQPGDGSGASEGQGVPLRAALQLARHGRGARARRAGGGRAVCDGDGRAFADAGGSPGADSHRGAGAHGVRLHCRDDGQLYRAAMGSVLQALR